VISDVPKTLVYELSNYVNTRSPLIPRSTIDKPPSAELRPDQKDSDSLPDYDVLDHILEDYVEENRAPEEIAAAHGYGPDLVRKVACLVDKSEYKRQQAAPGLKISEKAFGFGRRYPIAAKVEVCEKGSS
jgi:NAD+ synthetase